MAWVRLDDRYDENHKIASLGDLAGLGVALHVGMLCWSNRHLSDGRVPKGIVRRLVVIPDALMGTVTADALAARLAAAGVLRDDGDAWGIHDYLEFQPSRADVLESRASVSEVRAAAGRASGAARRLRREQTGNKPGTNREQNGNGSSPLVGAASAAPADRRAGAGDLAPLNGARAGVTGPPEQTGNKTGTNREQTGNTAGTDREQTGNPDPDPDLTDQTHTQRGRAAGGVPSLLVGGRHLSHAECGRVCFPESLFAEYLETLGGDRAAADARLRGLIRAHLSTLPSVDAGPIVGGGDQFRYWRRVAVVEGWFGAPVAPASAVLRGQSGRPAPRAAAPRPAWSCHHRDGGEFGLGCGARAHCFLRTLREVRAGDVRLEAVPEPLRAEVAAALEDDGVPVWHGRPEFEPEDARERLEARAASG